MSVKTFSNIHLLVLRLKHSVHVALCIMLCMEVRSMCSLNMCSHLYLTEDCMYCLNYLPSKGFGSIFLSPYHKYVGITAQYCKSCSFFYGKPWHWRQCYMIAYICRVTVMCEKQFCSILSVGEIPTLWFHISFSMKCISRKITN